MNIRKTLEKFDKYLFDRQFSLDVVVIGGAALNLLAVTERVTQDVDIIYPNELPQKLLSLVKDFANQESLPENWLNAGPAELLQHLPKDWKQRKRTLFQGKAIHLSTLGPKELLFAKCWAYIDRERDLEDIIAMRPLKDDLLEVAEWIKPLDANPNWPNHVVKMMNILIEKCTSNRNRGW